MKKKKNSEARVAGLPHVVKESIVHIQVIQVTKEPRTKSERVLAFLR